MHNVVGRLPRMSPALGASVTLALALALISSAHATTVTYTSSTSFEAAVGSSIRTQTYGSGMAGQLIASGGGFGGQTYTFVSGPSGDLQGGIITNLFNSVSGLSLGGNQSTGSQFFFGQDAVTISFATPLTAFGALFNVNANSGSYTVTSPAGTIATGSATYDHSTFVFAGLTSTTPFTSVTLSSTSSSLGSFNVAELEFASVPEPASLTLLGLGVAGVVAARRRRAA